eukprot:CAMPEP_0184859644 /NCGR_PEP_ID=MMETSP0580-20130426/4630_1 /TAXON_ID=1118495 /ORGANISM="Dactyliosolen fragilissimus" /LENGTH=701 /DNA_ID=CAMNT_0027356399 /DNA_START=174 /DNA_END=2279 /DNA_ORIENTATION=+
MSASTTEGSTLAIACGPVVTLWDVNNRSQYQSYLTQSGHIDAASVAGQDLGVEQFQPHGDASVVDLTWNHNSQVIASCSNSSSPDEDLPNISLTLVASKTKMASFSNFHTSKPTAAFPEQYTDTEPATSISFGGKAARSRYLCVSDASGYISVWDLKKSTRVRRFRLGATKSSNTSSHSKQSSEFNNPCTKACMDPSDTYVAGLSGSPMDGSLQLFHLRQGKLALSMRGKDGKSYGGGSCFEFSALEPNLVAVGTKQGSVLLWDLSTSSGVDCCPSSVMAQKHSGSVNDCNFSPNNKALLATCASDGTFAFHDVKSGKLIQMVFPWKLSTFKPPSGADSGKNGVTSLAFNADGIKFSTGTANGITNIYDLRKVGSGPMMMLDSSPRIGTGSYPVIRLEFGANSMKKSKTPKSHRKRTTLHNDEDKTPLKNSNVEENIILSQSDRDNLDESLANISLDHSNVWQTSPSPKTNHTELQRVDEENEYYQSVLERKPSVDKQELDTQEKKYDMPSLDKTNQIDDVSDQQQISSTAEVRERYYNDKAGEIRNTEGTVSDETRNIENDPVKSHSQIEFPSQSSFNPSNLETGLRVKSSSTIEGQTNFQQKELQLALAEKEIKLQNIAKQQNLETQNVIQEMIRDEMDALREDLEESMQILHCDCLRQFQTQSEEISNMFGKQRELIEKLLKENESLRQENEELRRVF